MLLEPMVISLCLQKCVMACPYGDLLSFLHISSQQWLCFPLPLIVINSQTTLWLSPKAFPKGTHNWQKQQKESVPVSKLIEKLLPEHQL